MEKKKLKFTFANVVKEDFKPFSFSDINELYRQSLNTRQGADRRREKGCR